MKRSRRKFSSKFKTKVVLEVLKERETVQQIAARYEIHPNQIGMWKRQFLDGAEGVFNGDVKAPEKRSEEEQAKLYKKIGQLQVEGF
jgi:transposase